jgi:hypothetical protein
MKRMNGLQGGDPTKLAKALVQLAGQAEPPLRWPAGADAVDAVEQKARVLLAQANAHRELSSSLGHDLIRAQFPHCPPGEEAAIAAHACRRVGRTASAKALSPEAVALAVIAHIRNVHTPYEDPRADVHAGPGRGPLVRQKIGRTTPARACRMGPTNIGRSPGAGGLGRGRLADLIESPDLMLTLLPLT